MRLAEVQTGGGHVVSQAAGGEVRPVVVPVFRLQLDNSTASQDLQLVSGDHGGTGGQLTGVQS